MREVGGDEDSGEEDEDSDEDGGGEGIKKEMKTTSTLFYSILFY